jgi:hypothetical protein
MDYNLILAIWVRGGMKYVESGKRRTGVKAQPLLLDTGSKPDPRHFQKCRGSSGRIHSIDVPRAGKPEFIFPPEGDHAPQRVSQDILPIKRSADDSGQKLTSW